MPEITDALSIQCPPLSSAQESPLDILNATAQAITQTTNGVLVGDLHISNNDDATMIRLGMSAPAGDLFWQGLLDAIYPNDRDYPVWIHSPDFPNSMKLPPYAILTPEQEKEDFVAHNADEFRRLVEKAMTTDDVRDIFARCIKEGEEARSEQDQHQEACS